MQFQYKTWKGEVVSEAGADDLCAQLPLVRGLFHWCEGAAVGEKIKVGELGYVERVA